MAEAIDYQEYERAAELQRRRNYDIRIMQREVKELAQRVAAKLNERIETGHETSAFMIIVMFALLKDGVLDIFLDFIGIGLIPIIGQIPGWFVSAVLFYFLWGKGWFRSFRPTYFIIVLILDSLPFIEELPLTVIDVLVAWHIVRVRARKAERHLDELKLKTREELEELDMEFA